MSDDGILIAVMIAMFVLTCAAGALAFLPRRKEQDNGAPTDARNLDALASPDARTAARGFMGLVLSGFISFCYISNSAGVFDSRKNLTQFSRTLANAQLMALSRSLCNSCTKD